MRKLIANVVARLTRRMKPAAQPTGAEFVGIDWAGTHVNCRSVLLTVESQVDEPSSEPKATGPEKTKPPPKLNRSPYGANGRSVFGSRLDPSRIPPDAGTAHWEAKHLFSPYGRLPTRHAHGVQVPEPPLAMVCPECDARRPPMGSGSVEECDYCGVTIVVHGSLIHWWWVEEIEVEPWGPKSGETDGRV